MKSLTLKMTVLILIAGITVYADNLVPNGNAEDASTIEKWHKNLTQNTKDKVSGNGCFQTTGDNIWAYSPDFIEIDPEKTYKLSGKFKSIGTDKGCCYLGLTMYDADKKLISYAAVTTLGKSLTKLAADAHAGDKVLKLEDCSKWNPKWLMRSALSFGAKKDYSDLPNRDLSPIIVKMEQKGDIYEVTLKKPLEKDYPAGTPVRQNYSVKSYQYYAASKQFPTNEWTTYSSKPIKGVPKTRRTNMFWPGTKYVKVIMVLNFKPKEGENCVTLVDDILFEEVK